jgi:hypothetical protein
MLYFKKRNSIDYFALVSCSSNNPFHSFLLMIKYYCFIIQLLLQYVYASTTDQRKHSTAHYFQNDSKVYILGGVDLLNSTGKQSITLRFDEKDYSLSPLKDLADTLVVGHTSHQIAPSNSIISLFGLPLQTQQSKEFTPLRYISSSAKAQNKTSSVQPSGRFHHTSILLNNKIYAIGGKSASNTQALIPPQDMIWTYSLSSQSWNQIIAHPPLSLIGMAGHVTIAYDQWLISCFGSTQNCNWFNTITYKHTVVTPKSIPEWPAARTYASMISLSSGKYLLFGGEADELTMLDDVWQLSVSTNFNMTWKRIKTTKNYKRSGHAGVLLAKNNSVVLYYGGQEGPNSLATEHIFFNLETMDWIQKHNTKTIVARQLGADLGNNAAVSHDQKSLSGGAIGGIIASIICVVGLAIGFFVWRKRHTHHQQFNESNSRAARFSRSPSPQQQEKIEISYHRSSFNNNKSTLRDSVALPAPAGHRGSQKLLSLPEIALYNSNTTKHNSVISLGGQFNFSTDDYLPRSRDSSILGYNKNNSPPPKIEFIESDSTKIELEQGNSNVPTESRPEYIKSTTSSSHSSSSNGFKRLTLNLFNSNTQPMPVEETQKKNRSSSLFQLRSSRLLHPNTPSTPGTPGTPDGRYPLRTNLQSRVSLGAKSVASVQWVGFNDGMDHGWRDSTGSSLHLAVTNAQRASSHYTSESTQSTPRSPVFPQHLRDSAIQYQLNDLEHSSWKTSPDLKKNNPTSIV